MACCGIYASFAAGMLRLPGGMRFYRWSIWYKGVQKWLKHVEQENMNNNNNNNFSLGQQLIMDKLNAAEQRRQDALGQLNVVWIKYDAIKASLARIQKYIIQHPKHIQARILLQDANVCSDALLDEAGKKHMDFLSAECDAQALLKTFVSTKWTMIIILEYAIIILFLVIILFINDVLFFCCSSSIFSSKKNNII